MTTRRVVPVLPGDEVHCRCGLRRAYMAFITYQTRNRHGLLVPVTAMKSFCTQHAKAYMRRFNLEVQSIETALDDRRKAVREREGW